MRIQYLIMLFLGFFGCQPEWEDPSYGTHQQAIRNGTRAPEAVDLTEGQVMAIGWLHPAGDPGSNFCTGTLVAPRVVATARHCIESGRARSIGFAIGLMPRNPVGTFAVKSAHGHPNLDAAILILENDVTERFDQVVPIPFNRTNLDEGLVGREIQAGGFGETYDRQTSGRFFATVEVSGVSATEVIVDGRGRQGLCFGDSGGPVIATVGEAGPSVLGVESWGDPSCVGVDHLIRLDILAEWIDEVTTEATRPADVECESLPAVGLCDGEVLRRCDNGRHVQIDCEAEGLECRLGDATRRLGCFEYDLCADVGSTGSCDGDTVVRCRFGDVVYDDCAMRDLTCESDSGGAFCSEVGHELTTEDMPPEDMLPIDEVSEDETDVESTPGNIHNPEDMTAADDEPIAQLNSENTQSRGCSTLPGRGAPIIPVVFLTWVAFVFHPSRRD